MDHHQPQNRLHPENCNKSQCKTCIFGENSLELAQSRKAEINRYLSTFEATHICHTTNKTCYGALEYQAMLLHRMGAIEAPTVESLLTNAQQYLFKEQDARSNRTSVYARKHRRKPSRKR